MEEMFQAVVGVVFWRNPGRDAEGSRRKHRERKVLRVASYVGAGSSDPLKTRSFLGRAVRLKEEQIKCRSLAALGMTPRIPFKQNGNFSGLGTRMNAASQSSLSMRFAPEGIRPERGHLEGLMSHFVLSLSEALKGRRGEGRR